MSELHIGATARKPGKIQEIASHSDTMAVFNIIDAETLENTDIDLFFPIGLPEGNDIIKAGFTLEPRFMSMTPRSGTTGETLITAIVPGIGIGLEKPEDNLNLVNAADGSILCNVATIKIVEYGKMTCWSKRTDFGEEPITVQLKHAGKLYDC